MILPSRAYIRKRLSPHVNNAYIFHYLHTKNSVSRLNPHKRSFYYKLALVTATAFFSFATTEANADNTTFKINAGKTSFTATIPADTLATYEWKDGEQPRQWLTVARNGGFDKTLEETPIHVQGSASATINVNSAKEYQTIDGFGAALTDSAAKLITKSSQKDTIIQRLFGTGDKDAGLTFARVPMGSSDLMYDSHDVYTYEDTEGNFSIDKDIDTINILKKAESITGNSVKIIGTPWSAPGWMKNGNKILPNNCDSSDDKLKPNYYKKYATYFKKYIDEYDNAGLRPWMVSMQNEPESCKQNTPSTQLTANDEVELSKALRNQLPNDIKILGWDHNRDNENYVKTLIQQGQVDAIGYHCYSGNNYQDQAQEKATYVTECTGSTTSSNDVASNMGWEVSNLIIGPLRYGSRGSIYWSMAQRSDGSPTLTGSDVCTDCRGMITVNDSNSYEPSQDFYFWAHFSKFVRPGAVRIDSSQEGNLSTVAFREGNTTILVVLNSSQKANGGSGDTQDSKNLYRHIVQWNGDNNAQKSSWLVGSDGNRRWISDGSTFNCLKYDASIEGPEAVSAQSLDRYPNLKDVWAVCGTTMGKESQLEIGTYLKSQNGARLTLTQNGLSATDTSGNKRWAPEGKANRLILQEDQNLVLYDDNNHAVWASGTQNSGAIWLSIRDDGSFALFDKNNNKVWTSNINTDDYKGKIVLWDGDHSSQKASWLVGADKKRRWIHDWQTFKCLKDAGFEDATPVSSDVLDKLPNLDNVWASCGSDRIGPNGTLEKESSLQAGDYKLTMAKNGLILNKKDKEVWSKKNSGIQLILQPDGNLVEYDGNRKPVWATGTNGKQPGWLVLGDDGSLRLYDSKNKEIWKRQLTASSDLMTLLSGDGGIFTLSPFSSEIIKTNQLNKNTFNRLYQ